MASTVTGLRRVQGQCLNGGGARLFTGLYAFPYFGLLNTKVAGLVLLAMVLSLCSTPCSTGRKRR